MPLLRRIFRDEPGDHGLARVLRWLLPLGVLVAGFWFIPLAHTCQLGCVPGDAGDARFNGIILEHFYRWVTGQDRSLLSPNFFYPMRGALTFSDNHWGTAWIYSIYRGLGADRYQAFDIWYLTAYVVNFTVSYAVLRKLRFSPVASTVAAFAFTFPMPVIAKHFHAQLVYRFLIPVGLLCWQRFRETTSWRWVGWLSLAVAGQFYISIYLGYFMLLFLAAWILVQWRVDQWGPSGWFSQWRSWRTPAARRDLVIASLMVLVSLAALVALMHPYLHYAKVYGFGRPPDEIASMLPRPQSYLLADESLIWGRLTSGMFSVPVRGEQQIAFGIGIIGLAIVGLVRSRQRIRWIALLSFLLLVVLTLSVDGHSLYMWLAKLPGVNSIRAVARIGLVMALPLALLVAVGVDSVRNAGAPLRILVGLLVVAMAAESVAMRTVHFDMGQARAQTAHMMAQLPSPLPAKAILFNPSRPDTPFYITELDGMLLSQAANRPTLNGYSGNLPPGYEPHSGDYPCVQVAIRLESAKRFYAERLKRPMPAAASAPVIMVGIPNCSSVDVWRQMPLSQSSKVSLHVDGVDMTPDGYQVTITVLNGTGFTLNTAANTVNPLHLSWQVVDAQGTMDPKAWASRVAIGGHGALLPGESRRVSILIPAAQGGTGKVAVNAVLEGRAWLDQYGFRPALVSLPPDNKIP
ncbi:MAG: hypothetical protein WBW32_17990 [Luteibacter sp.]